MKKDKYYIIALVLVLLAITLLYPAQSKYEKAIELGGEWYLNNQDEDFLYYKYDVVNARYFNESHVLREVASLWVVAELSESTGHSDYNKLARRGFNYFENYFRREKENDFYYVNITPPYIRLGDSAFIILSLLNMDHPVGGYYLEKFADGILFHQNADGSFQTHFFSNISTNVDYYPGEALLALMSLYEETQDERYLEATQNAFPFYRDYWRGNKNTAFVPWQTRAYQKLYSATGDEEVADFVFEMNDWMLEGHSPAQGCSGFFFRGVVEAVFIEGVTKAYELALEVNDTVRAECYANFSREGLDYVLTLQVTDKAFEKEAIGGFMGSPTYKIIRVDNNQHAVMALMDAKELGLLD